MVCDAFPLRLESARFVTSGARGGGERLSQFSRRSHRRRAVGLHADDRFVNLVRSLNELDGFSSDDATPLAAAVRAPQADLQHLRDRVADMGRPPSHLKQLSDGASLGEIALRELLGAEADYAGEALQSTPIEVPRVSLPDVDTRPVPLATALGPDGPLIVGEFHQSALLPIPVVDAKLSDLGLARPYTDPVLRRSPKTYAQLLVRVFKAGMIELGGVSEVVGLFTVPKKNGIVAIGHRCEALQRLLR